MSEPRALRAGEARGAAEVLAASHADYPAFRHVFADRRRRAQALLPFFVAAVGDAIPFGTVHGADHERRLAAVAVWLPPGAFPWSPRRKLRATPAFLRVLAADPRRFPSFVRYGANAERAHPTEPHWYLVVLGVHPDAQGRGLGTALMAPGLARADEDGLPCHLETSDPRNVAFYARFGFEVVDPALALVPDGPTHVAMRRAPR